MSWRDRFAPRRMARVAVVAPETRWRTALVAVGTAGTVEPDTPGHEADGPASAALRRATTARPGDEAPALLSVEPPDLDPTVVDDRALSLLRGEVELERVTAAARTRDGITALAGWAPADSLRDLELTLAPLGAGVMELAAPKGVEPPTVLAREPSAEPFRPLVETYATVPYRNVDPTWFAAFAYVVMFGIMFGDVAHGALVVAGALWLRSSRRTLATRFHRIWPLVGALGLSACLFGFLYGELAGPTGAVPTLWLSPLDEPTRFLAAAVVIGTGLLAMSYALAIVNRWREGGFAYSLYSPQGIAGASLFGGATLVTVGLVGSVVGLTIAGLVVAAVGLALAAVGLRVAAGPGAAGATQAVVELLDLLLRLGSNVVSFARLAAFGLTHAALGSVIWDATTALWDVGFPGWLAAALLFVVGNALAFALEALVAGVQALRLEYYELFSRVFATEGQPFRPWHVPLATTKEQTCSSG